MTGSSSVEIQWSLGDDEWKLAHEVFTRESPGNQYDRSGGPFYELLWGPFQIVHGGEWLFSLELMSQLNDMYTEPFPRRDVYPPGPQMSLLDLAYKFAGLLQGDDLSRVDPREIVIRQEDGDFELYVDRSGPDIIISSNLFVDLGLQRSTGLTVPRDALVGAIQRFLTNFAAEVRDHLPESPKWQSFAFLREFSPDRGGPI